MSVLAPLYLLGALGISLPILFHLIRRRPKGEVEFSSLMFLDPTPPRLTRRSRLENWPLLLMRALALLLLAIAFARPFLRNASFLQSDNAGRRLMLVMDTSASMQRTGLWDQAKRKANEVIDDLSSGDQLAIVAYDKSPRTLLSYDQATELTLDQIKSAARSAINSAAPTWNASNLGTALSYSADLAVTYEPEDDTLRGKEDQESLTSSTGPAHMILISDMQEGSDIESLQVYAWPKELRLDVRRVEPDKKTNASAQILNKSTDREGDRVRVRVSNSADADNSRFRLAWMGGSKSTELPVQVPPGETRVVRMPLPDVNVTSLVVSDDEHSFDNQRYLVSPQAESLTLLYVGSDTSKNTNVDKARDSLLFYLQRVPLNNARRSVTITAVEPSKLSVVPDAKNTPLVVVAEPLSTDAASLLKQYVTSGGKVLFVMSKKSDAAMAAAIQTITDQQLNISEAKIKDYAMFSQIDFRHPIFETMADPQFNDFTKVKFWSHRKLADVPADWQIAASFDDGDPAIIEHSIDEGKLWIMATGWQPSASQLALSTKFLPLVFSFFDTLGGKHDPFGSVELGDPIAFAPSADASIKGPDGMEFEFKSQADLDQIDQPGVYQYTDDDKTIAFAVNLAESESQTTPLADDSLERFGIQIGEALTTAQLEAAERQLRDVELEKKQKVWQWLLVAALAFLAIETLWSGLLSRGGPRTEAA